ncbi:MAG: 16S rRNA methyltransferase [Candidatus Heimdallarchaeota archaeon]|nr:16S rRNA methyltransferase [Candidatus Heimdallarchaeota archaeon]
METIPIEIQHNDIIKKHAQKKGKKSSQIILDSSSHYKIMNKLKDSKKRGRPDIIHYCLLNLLGAPLVLKYPNLVEVYIHTINNLIIEFNPKTRLPRNFNRFLGLLEQLFTLQIIKSKDDVLIQIHQNKSILDIVKDIPYDNRFLFTSRGKEIKILDFFMDYSKENICIIIGGFPHGSFSTEILDNFPNKYSIFPESLDAWIILNQIIYSRESTIE